MKDTHRCAHVISAVDNTPINVNDGLIEHVEGWVNTAAYMKITGVTVWACMRFACVIRSGYLALANQHTSSEGLGSRDLRQTRVEPYWIEIVGHSSTKHKFSLPLRIFNRL